MISRFLLYALTATLICGIVYTFGVVENGTWKFTRGGAVSFAIAVGYILGRYSNRP